MINNVNNMYNDSSIQIINLKHLLILWQLYIQYHFLLEEIMTVVPKYFMYNVFAYFIIRYFKSSVSYISFIK